METRCKQTVATDAGWHFRRCSRKAVADGYCKQHDPIAVAAKRARASEAYHEKWRQKEIARCAYGSQKFVEWVIGRDTQLGAELLKLRKEWLDNA